MTTNKQLRQEPKSLPRCTMWNMTCERRFPMTQPDARENRPEATDNAQSSAAACSPLSPWPLCSA